VDLERARERQTHKVTATGMAEFEHLREALDPALNKANALAAPADGDEPQPASRRRRRHRVGGLVISRDDRGAAGLDQIREQAKLGGEISLPPRTILQTTTPHITEPASRSP